MKKLLFALTLFFAIMPLCAMEKEIKKVKRTALEQERLDDELNDLMREEWSHNGITKIRALLKKGADPKATQAGNIPCLIQSSNPQVICMLLDYGADILQPDDEGNTVFHYESTSDQLALLLLYAQERGLDLGKISSQRNDYGETPLSITEHRHRAEQEASLSMLPDRRIIMSSGVRKRLDGYNSDDSDHISEDDAQGANDSYTSDDVSIPNDLKKRLLILSDPHTYIPLFCPDILQQFQQERMKRKLKKSWTIYKTGSTQS